MNMGILSIVALAIGAVAFLLPIALGIAAIALSNQEERRTVIAMVAAGGLLLLLCVCAAAGAIWLLTTR